MNLVPTGGLPLSLPTWSQGGPLELWLSFGSAGSELAPLPHKRSCWIDFSGNWKSLNKPDLGTESKVMSVCNPCSTFCTWGSSSCSQWPDTSSGTVYGASQCCLPQNQALEQNATLWKSNSNHFLLNPYFNILECPSIKMLIFFFFFFFVLTIV